MHTDPLIPLDMLATGEWGEVVEIHGDTEWVARMGELGLQSGNRLQIVQSGCPCLIRVANSRLCVRGEHAMQIFVRPVSCV